MPRTSTHVLLAMAPVPSHSGRCVGKKQVKAPRVTSQAHFTILQSMSLEAKKQQLLARQKALKQQEQVLEAIMTASEQEQQESIAEFKADIIAALQKLKTIPGTFAAASKQIDSVYGLSSDLSWRIKEVDTAISRCAEAAAYVRHFADLAECLGSIDGLIARKEVAQSCDFMRRLLEIPSALLTHEDAERIQNSRKSLLVLLREKIKEDGAEPGLLFGYFSDCDAQEEGLRQIADLAYLSVLEETRHACVELSQLPKASPMDDSIAPHVGTYVKLLDCIAQRIVKSIPILNDTSQFVVFVRLLLERCDERIADIIKKYSDYRSLDVLERKCDKMGEDLELRVIDSVNEEISNFAKQWSSFEKFVKDKIRTGIQSEFFKTYKFKSPTAAGTGLPQQSEASRSLQFILMSYATLTQAYIRKIAEDQLALVKAMKDTEEVTNAIEDLFFVFHRSLNRSIKTQSVAIPCTIFNVITEICRRDLMQAVGVSDDSITARFRAKATGFSGKASVMINACRMSHICLQKLIALIETTIIKLFTDDNLTAMQLGLRDLKTCGSDLEKVLTGQIDRIVNSLTPACKSMCMPFRNMQWSSNITAQTEAQLQDGLKGMWEQAFEKYRKELNEPNYNALMDQMSAIFAESLEAAILQKNFNQNGAVLFKRMVKFMSGLFRHPDKFRRLTDISCVLTLSGPEDLPQVWGQKAENPVQLTYQELKAVVRMRADWRDSDLGVVLSQ